MLSFLCYTCSLVEVAPRTPYGNICETSSAAEEKEEVPAYLESGYLRALFPEIGQSEQTHHNVVS